MNKQYFKTQEIKTFRTVCRNKTKKPMKEMWARKHNSPNNLNS